ncbi:MAG: hypothetical protein NZ958_00530 [Bacteroidia bacterium]|nr:hypothetical protein [Bacteroidia bacterium]
MTEWEEFLVPCNGQSEGCKDCTDGVKDKYLMKFFSAKETFIKHEYVSEKGKVCDCFVVYKDKPVLCAVEILAGRLTKRELEDKAEQLEACRSFVKQCVCSKSSATSLKIRCILVYGRIERELKIRRKGRTEAERLAQKKEIVLMDYRSYREKGIEPFVR